jgi:hypothetical protein
MGVSEGWRCADVGCGPVGVLPVLSDLVGPSGRLVGMNFDEDILRHAGQICSGRPDVSVFRGNGWMVKGIEQSASRFVMRTPHA